ncbi:MAG: tRNA 2-selenouridine(34) synthase MnmH [Helicobacteraceae bacterium CG2_30_36_10]|nr:MAG: tRNA 2-selenouridine(34) synthase MnmH [Helicobacteraceae bacterium CG2_30_36_10]
MSNLTQSSDFKSIVLNSTPLIDVRAPIEFNKGAFPHAVNLPLINDEERHLIGIKYKEEGNAEAVKLGLKLVSGDVKKERVGAWSDFIRSNPQSKLYCFRGGQRSKISQEWISEAEKEIVRLKGGYKAFRNYLMQEIEDSSSRFKPLILGGRTGSGKTILLKRVENSIDLEALANHRGSSFGRKITPQPTQINFENTLAYDLIQKLDKGFEHLLFEDEGKRVGSISIPKTFADYLSQAPLIVLETPDEERIQITFNEYILSEQESYKKMFESEGLGMYKRDIENAMLRISKRMGSERYKIVCVLFENAFNEQTKSGDLELYKEWIAYLLKEYYDPMYDYQIQKQASRVVFRGSHDEIINYLHSSGGTTEVVLP